MLGYFYLSYIALIGFIDKHDAISVLFQTSTFPQIRQLRFLVGALFHCPTELRGG